MDYNLALVLKTAGFPQQPFWVNYETDAYGSSWYFLSRPEACPQRIFADPDEFNNGISRGDDLVKIPSLSELIEMCGDKLKMLSKEPRKDYWHAVTLGKKWTKIQGDGSTPEIAVAHLYLALNKKP